MGIPLASGLGGTTVPAGDRANQVLTGSLAGVAVTPGVQMWGAFNVAIWTSSFAASTGSVQLEKSFDGGVTWLICGVGGAGQQALYPNVGSLAIVVCEPEAGVAYRLNCTALSDGGPMNYRISSSGAAALAWVPGVSGA